MGIAAWMIGRQARAALSSGQPEEASRLLDELTKTGHKRGYELAPEVARGYAERAERHLGLENAEAAWADLLKAEGLSPADPVAARVRETLQRLALAEARVLLEMGNPQAAREAVLALKARPSSHPAVAVLEEAAAEWLVARELAGRGEFAAADAAFGRVRDRLGGRTKGLDAERGDWSGKSESARQLRQELGLAIDAADWPAALQAADKVLALASNDREAAQARNRAFQALQDHLPTLRPLAGPPAVSARPNDLTPTPMHVPARRFVIWFDHVGAYLVCTGPRVVFGQASAEGQIDVPLFADVSRFHATMARDEECYTLESSKPVQVGAKSASRHLMRCGDLIRFGHACDFLFQQKVPGCLSARLLLHGTRRLPQAVDGVLLMSDMLVFGPGEAAHVNVPDLPSPLYLIRQKDQIAVKWTGEFLIEGVKHRDRAVLPAQGVVSSAYFTFAIEAVG